MTRFSVFGTIYSLLAAAGLISSYFAWQTSQKASVLVEWSTASELDTAGFNLYRSDRPDGPFSLVNPTLIPAASDPLIGGAYQYKDQAVKPGQTYYYELEDVEISGKSTRVGRLQVKAQPAGRLELLASAVLSGIGLVGLGSLAFSRRSHS